MSFLTPLFLVALAGLAIPVLLHLIQKERKNVVPFPSLMFLRRIPYQSVQRRRIRHWLLLCMRLAALALIVLAFARPFFQREDLGAAAAAGAREVVVLLDRSYSMGYADRWPQALAAAREAFGGLGPADRGTLVLFAAGAEVTLRSTGDRSRLLAALAGVEPGAAGTRFGPALKLAGSILAESALPRREVMLVSDFQRAGWQGAEGVRLPDGGVLVPVPVTSGAAANRAVTPVALQRTSFEGQQRVVITAGIVNHSGAAASGVPVSLEIGGRAIGSRSVDLDANGAASTTFEPITIAERNMKATVRLPDDALARDNAFHFVLSPEEPIRVIIAGRPGAPREAGLYLSRALAFGESPRFQTTALMADAMTAEDLSRAAVVIVNDAPLAQSTADRLARFVQGGGGLLAAVGERASWPQGADVMPAAIEAPVDRASGTARLGALEYGHPVFELFRAPRSGDFSSARFYGYRAVKPLPAAQVLARFDDGSPALLERRVAAGRVLLWTSTLDLHWNDLPLKPVFLPFVHRAVRHLSGYREAEPWRTVGDVVDPSLASSQLPLPQGETSARVVLTPSGQRMTMDEEGPDVLELTEQGFYEIRAPSRDTEPPFVVASNVNLSESDLTPMDPQEIVAAAMGRAGGPGAADPGARPSDQAQESAQRIWWFLLFAGLLLLGAETILANRSTV